MTQLQTLEPRGTALQEQRLTASDIRAQVNLIQEVLQGVMKKGTHYDVIAGTRENTLLKPGAEKIMATFRLAADPEVEDLSDRDSRRYRVKVRLYSPDGRLVGAGVGECSTDEEKYRWRKAVCDEEYEETPEDRRRTQWKHGRNGPWKAKQVRTNPADLSNTVLKMAKKRGLVDAVLTATAASDIFTQDIEDLPEEYREAVQTERQSSKPRPGKDAVEKATENSEHRDQLIADLEAVAEEGEERLLKSWQSLSDEDRTLVGAEFGRLKKLAKGK